MTASYFNASVDLGRIESREEEEEDWRKFSVLNFFFSSTAATFLALLFW